MKEENKLADEHWSYIKSLLETHQEEIDVIEKIGFHYKTAFIHGWKHCLENFEVK